jgi:hypothetical protein
VFEHLVAGHARHPPVQQDGIDVLVQLFERLLSPVGRPDVVLFLQMCGVDVRYGRLVIDDEDCCFAQAWSLSKPLGMIDKKVSPVSSSVKTSVATARGLESSRTARRLLARSLPVSTGYQNRQPPSRSR